MRKIEQKRPAKIVISFSRGIIFTTLMASIISICCSNLEERETRYENGQPKEKWYVKLDDNNNYMSHGKYIAWHETGHIKQKENWKDGILDGEFITWHENGMKWQVGRYEDGKMTGTYQEWDPNGVKRLEGLMADGKQQGKWTFWDENGNIYKQEDYKDGELIE